MNSGAKNAFAVALGIGLGMLALAVLSGAFTIQTFSPGSAANYGTSLATSLNSPPQNLPAIGKVQNQTLAGITNFPETSVTIAILAGVSLIVAVGFSLGVSSKFRSEDLN